MADAAADRYRRAKGIALAALELEPAQRGQLVGAECGDDAALRQEVLWLIEAAETADSSDEVPEALNVAARQAVETVHLEAPLPRDYRLLERLDEGGMGVIYLAERVDGDMRQRVALKLLQLGLGHDDALARRFAAERRILATLNHPNIAHLVDGGLTAEGRPFLAMEYVDGERIDQWCERHALSLRARIELFLKVCAAVDYAHRHLVIHRDIKPANILVTADGEPKLLDFGIARLLDDDAGAARTKTSLQAFTPVYASPEQIEGHALSTATDVYSLGVVLYELMAGVRPFDHLSSAHQLSNAIVSGETPPPSKQVWRRERATSSVSASEPVARQAAMRRRIPPDVDAIVLKAMRREPAQRYVSVAELAGDLRAHLASRPVQARRRHWVYRAQRFAWRRRGVVAAGVAVAVLLVGFVLNREVQLERIARERDRAEAVTEFMNELFVHTDSLPSRGNDVTVREMLDRGARELQAAEGMDAAFKGSMLLAMGRAYNALSLGHDALPLLQSAHSLLAPLGRSDERAAVLAELGRAYGSMGDTADSIAADTEAIKLLQRADGDHADEITRLRIRKLFNQAIQVDAPLSEIAAELQDILVDLQARAEPPDALLFKAYEALSLVYMHRENADERAMAMAEDAEAVARRLYGDDDPRVLPARHSVAIATGRVDLERAIPLYASLTADIERVVGTSLQLANALNNMATVLSRLGRVDESVAAFERAADIARETGSITNWGVILVNLANHYNASGQPDKARGLMQEILPELADRATSGTGLDRFGYAAALRTLAEAWLEQSEPEEAERIYVQAEQVFASVDSEFRPMIRADVLRGLAASRLDQGRHKAAREALDRLDALNREEAFSPGSEPLLHAATMRVELLDAAGDHAAAEQLAAEAHARACDEGEPHEASLDDLRAAWTTELEHLGRTDVAAQLPDCVPTPAIG